MHRFGFDFVPIDALKRIELHNRGSRQYRINLIQQWLLKGEVYEVMIVFLLVKTHNPSFFSEPWILSGFCFATAAWHTDHGGWPSHWGQTESADGRTQGSPAGPRCGLHRRDGPLWSWANPRESRARQRGRWVLRSRRNRLFFAVILII